MHQAVIYIDPVSPAPIGFAQAAGMPGDIRFDFKTQGNLAYPNVADLYPQLVLRPFTRPDIHAYDIEINDPTGASGIAKVPGVVMNDRFSLEVYARNSAGQPQRMLAVGRADLNGYGYVSTGPLGPASYPTGAEGPAGPTGARGPTGLTGEPGVRGSRWYSGAGAPSISVPPGDRIEGDMWLDENTCDFWRWDGAAWRGYRSM
jgi:hypothetical protein